MLLMPSFFREPSAKKSENKEEMPIAPGNLENVESTPEKEGIKNPPVVEGGVGNEKDITLGSLMGRVPSVESKYVEVDLFNKSRKTIYKKGLEPTFENFRNSFKEIIKDMDKARLTADDRNKLAKNYLNELDFFESLVGKANRDLIYRHFEGKIEELKKEVKARIIQ